MNAVHRILNYIDFTPQEKPYHIEPTTEEERASLKAWPSKADIEISNVSYRYHSNTPIVLKNISLSINSHERVTNKYVYYINS